MTVEYGGKNIYGATIGIMMLDTQFPRIKGDIANATTWQFPVQYRIVKGASPDLVVRHKAKGLLDKFIFAAKDLIDHGADALTTNCGFLSLIQDEVRTSVGVPVATSSLLQVPMVNAMLGGDLRAAILTISKAHLTEEHLRCAGVPIDTPIGGTDGGEFSKVILDDLPEMDFEKCRAEHIDASADLVRNNNNIGAIVLECTNMAPYAADIRKVTQVPIYSIYSLICWLQAGTAPRRFEHKLEDPRFSFANS